MNRRMVINLIGRIVLTEAALLLLPCAVAVYYGELVSLRAFAAAVLIAVVIGGALLLFTRRKDNDIYAGEGFVTVAFAWIILSVIGCLPFIISGEIPRFADAFFEIVSGFTTTGASILTDVEAMSNSMLFWRSFSHWIGGMGVLVFVMAIVPTSKGSMNIMRAEMPGPIIGKLVPRVKDTAKILYLIYIALTLVEIGLLYLGKMPLFDSILHSFGTAGTGGFGVKADSIAGYSPYLQWVIAIFMLIFGVNFNLYFLILMRRFRAVIESTELWVYVGIVVASNALIAANISSMYDSFGETVRHSAFQVASIVTTTGYSTADFTLWPGLSQGILLILMFTGACAGSTAGGLKLSRVVLLVKLIGREIKKMLHPRSVSRVRFEGKSIDETTLSSVGVYFAIYMICFFVIFLLICFEPFGIETDLTAVVACFNNIGPGFGAVGPAGSFAAYSDYSKIVLSIAMLLGRLEIFPMIIAFSPSTWTKKYR